MLSKSEKFILVHDNPLPFFLENKKGKDLNLKTEEGKDAHIYEIKAEKQSKLFVFVIHEWWGLNDYIKKEAEKIFSTLGEVNVIAIDLYDGRIAKNNDSASKYMQAVNSKRAETIIKTVISYVGKDAKIASIGWCFGGGWSMKVALMAGKQSLACVMYYGMPEENIEKIKTLNAPVYFIWPEQDQWINKEVVTKFEANMKAAKKRFTIKSYDANHAFANPSNPIYNQEMAEDAYKNVIAFIKTNLK
jgi:carboxymethylenebutenolidase